MKTKQSEPHSKFESMIRRITIVILCITGILIMSEFGFGYFLQFLIISAIYMLIHTIIVKTGKKQLNRPWKSPWFLYIIIMIWLIQSLFSSSFDFFTSTQNMEADILFFLVILSLGIFLAKIVIAIIYIGDPDLELLNSLYKKRRPSIKDEPNYFHLFGIRYIESLIAFIIFTVCFYFLNSGMNSDYITIIGAVLSIYTGLSFTVILYIFLKKRYPEIIMTLSKPNKKYITIALISGVVIFIANRFLSSVNYYYINNILEVPWVVNESGSYYYPYSETVSFQFVDLISLVFIAPVLEELLFRGFLYTVLKKRYGITKAILYSTIIFVWVHQGIYYRFIPMMMTCIIFPYIYEKSRSLIPPMIVHSVFNFMVFIF